VSIKRYNSELELSDTGGWVSYEDHEAELARLRVALDKISAIRHEIIRTGFCNWSRDVYPLVEILDAALAAAKPLDEMACPACQRGDPCPENDRIAAAKPAETERSDVAHHY
jgi:hypothetical protein